MRWMHGAAVCAILLCPALSKASSVFRCEDADGHVTFSQHGCGDHQQQHIQSTHNPRPGSGVPVPLAIPNSDGRVGNAARIDASENTLTVVGGQQDGCDNAVTGSARREAIIRKQVRAGMTRSDVESALGKPDRISTRNGQTTYHYASKHNGERRTVTFDQEGCVTGRR